MLSLLRSNSFSDIQLHQLSAAIGEREKDAFRKLSSNSAMALDKKDQLMQVDYSSVWEQADCPIFKAFLSGVCDLKYGN